MAHEADEAELHRLTRRPGGKPGEILEIEPPRRLVLSWQNELFSETRAEGYSRLTYELEEKGEAVKLTVIHEIDRADSKLIGMTSNGGPPILPSLKSLLETGESLEETRRWPKGF